MGGEKVDAFKFIDRAATEDGFHESQRRSEGGAGDVFAIDIANAIVRLPFSVASWSASKEQMNLQKYLRSEIQSMAPYKPGEQPGAAKVIKLNTNENPYPPSAKVLEAIRKRAGGWNDTLTHWGHPFVELPQRFWG